MRVANEVLAVLSSAKVSGCAVQLTGQLDRNLYMKTDKVLQAAGGKWSKKEKAHIFDSDAESRIDQIIVTGDVEVPKDEYNYFPSPKAVVDRLVYLANIKDEMVVLEPSAGRGAIVKGVISAASKVMVDMHELNAANYALLLSADFPLSGIAPEPADFLTANPKPVYDRVVMNPPFMKQADIKHVLHALKFLKDGGILVSVMSAGVTFRENKLTSEFRELVAERGGYFEELPDGSFKDSGTMVNTVIVVIPN